MSVSSAWPCVRDQNGRRKPSAKHRAYSEAVAEPDPSEARDTPKIRNLKNKNQTIILHRGGSGRQNKVLAEARGRLPPTKKTLNIKIKFSYL